MQRLLKSTCPCTKGVITMARIQMTKTKKENIYSYIDTDGKKKFSYRYKYYDSYGKRREKTKQGFKTQNEAERALIEVKAAVLDGNEQLLINEHLTLSKWLEFWIDAKKSNWKPTTYRQRELFCRAYLVPLIGDYKLTKLTKFTVQNNLVDAMIKKGYSANTIKGTCSTLATALNDAVNEGRLDRRRYLKLDFSKLKVTDKRISLTVEELDTLLSCVKETENITRNTIILTLAYTGMRKGEAAGLKWSDIDFDKKTIRVSKTRDDLGERLPKTRNSIRTIRMTELLHSHLKQYRSWCIQNAFFNGKKFKEDNYVFITQAGDAISTGYVTQIFKALQKKHGLENVSAHKLRHTFASILISKQVPPTTVAEMLGNTPEMVMRVYAHSMQDNELEAVKILDDVINF